MRLGGVDVIFHEFSHPVQFSVGLLSGNAGVEDRKQVSRRIELQAECFTPGPAHPAHQTGLDQA